jgi:hypothetical protein
MNTPDIVFTLGTLAFPVGLFTFYTLANRPPKPPKRSLTMYAATIVTALVTAVIVTLYITYSMAMTDSALGGYLGAFGPVLMIVAAFVLGIFFHSTVSEQSEYVKRLEEFEKKYKATPL